jgi:hypothetical protein
MRTSPRLPLGASAVRAPPQRNVEGSRHQWASAAAFPPVPCRSEQSRQGADRENDRPYRWFQHRSRISQYENVRCI